MNLHKPFQDSRKFNNVFISNLLTKYKFLEKTMTRFYLQENKKSDITRIRKNKLNRGYPLPFIEMYLLQKLKLSKLKWKVLAVLYKGV